jgi:NAD(P)-dependent dehydrogenase (short-subunit alcohol dehydrogenase family)
MQTNRHDGRTVVVTGGSSGIGRGVAFRFAEEGARVVNADVDRDPAVGKHHAPDDDRPTDRYIEEVFDRDAMYVETDVSDREAVEAMIETTVDRFGGVDVLVNNAGVYTPITTEHCDVEDWKRMLDVDLEGVFLCTKAAIPHLKETKGQIVNIASIHAFGGGGGPAYASAKAAVVNLTRDLAVELGDAEIQVNSICPGYIKTPIQDYLSEAEIDEVRERTPLPWLGDPEDIGDAAVFLASDEARFISGSSLTIDGGMTADV